MSPASWSTSPSRAAYWASRESPSGARWGHALAGRCRLWILDHCDIHDAARERGHVVVERDAGPIRVREPRPDPGGRGHRRDPVTTRPRGAAGRHRRAWPGADRVPEPVGTGIHPGRDARVPVLHVPGLGRVARGAAPDRATHGIAAVLAGPVVRRRWGDGRLARLRSGSP